ncbi:transposase DDE domain protein [Streptococcus pneumoniae GA43264]|nr:transposase DDE domain protein [Streptococcus pneumoniae GA43264]
MAFSDGHTHDFTLFKESIGQSLPETTLAFVDLGYLGILKFHENTFIPAKNSKNRRLSEDDKQLNKEMSAIRIEIEHFNAKSRPSKSCQSLIVTAENVSSYGRN